MHLNKYFSFIMISFLFTTCHLTDSTEPDTTYQKFKSVLVVMVAQNKAHTLPYILHLFESLKYPKQMISFYIRSYRSVDSTNDILMDWWSLHKEDYDYIDVEYDVDPPFLPGEDYPTLWTEAGANRMIKFKQESLNFAREMMFDYVWYLDPDVFLSDTFILQRLILAERPIVAPMLDSVFTYSNFFESPQPDYWEGIKKDHDIFFRKTHDCHEVFMVTSCVLINLKLNGTEKLSFTYPRKELENIHLNADNIALGLSALHAGIPIEVCNENVFGFMMMPRKASNLTQEMQQVTDIKVKSLEYFLPMSVSPYLQKYLLPKIKKDTLGFDQIYILNLDRRHNRRERMLQSMEELGIDARIFKSVDGLKLTSSYIKRLGIKPLSNILNLQEMTLGIVGSFLTKYFVWQDVIKNNFTKVMVLEDDASFKPDFRKNVAALQNELNRLNIEWDFVYLYRDATSCKEKKVRGSEMLIRPMFSYSLMAFIITKKGAQKLVNAKPLGKIINTDWFISTMYDGNNNEELNDFFPVRNLKAFSMTSYPVVPTHEEGEVGHVSDTMNSPKFHEAFPDIRYDSEDLQRFAKCNYMKPKI